MNETMPGGREVLDLEDLQRRSDEIMRLVSSPEFLAQVRAVVDAEPEERLTEAASRLTPSALREAGVPVPDTTRISSRYFEEGRGDEVVFTDVDGSQDLIQELDKTYPGIIGDLVGKRPDIFGRPEWWLDPIGPRASACVCVGGGAGGISVCVGGGA